MLTLVQNTSCFIKYKSFKYIFLYFKQYFLEQLGSKIIALAQVQKLGITYCMWLQWHELLKKNSLEGTPNNEYVFKKIDILMFFAKSFALPKLYNS